MARATSADSTTWITSDAEVWNESIMYPREMETGSKEGDGVGEGKSLGFGFVVRYFVFVVRFLVLP